MSLRYFGTDGIRGPVDGPLFQPDFLRKLGGALARHFYHQKKKDSLCIVAGRDTRASGSAIFKNLTGGCAAYPTEVLDCGIVPTPAVALLTQERNADFGIAITASHNPANDNGIKIFSADGTKLSRKEEEQIEALLLTPGRASEENKPNIIDIGEIALRTYLQSMEVLSRELDLNGMRIVCDTANGATCRTTPTLLRKLGAEVILLGNQPDGHNINQDCGSEHGETLIAQAKEQKADFALAHDGDGDRVIFADKEGHLVSGDQILGIFALYALRQNRLPNGSLVATVHSNSGLDIAVKNGGGKVLRADVGDRNVALLMEESQSCIGGESSGHFILRHFSTTGDGLLATLFLLRIMKNTGQDLARLREEIPLLPQASGKLQVREKIPLSACPHLSKAIKEVETILGESGRTLIRYSGTEPLLRLLVEAADKEQANNLLAQLLTAAAKDLG